MKIFSWGIGRRFLCHLLLVCIFTIIVDGIVFANGIEQESIKQKSNKPYCGLSCLYTTMKLAGKEVIFTELVKPEYLGSRNGSSLVELKKAAEDNEMYAESTGGLTIETLKKSPYPIILHVKSVASNKNYDHYELFLGVDNGQAKIFNPPNPVGLVPFYKLVPRWDGIGLIVSAERIDLAQVFAPARKQFVLYVVVGITVIVILHWVKERRLYLIGVSKSELFGLSTAQAVGFGLIALIWGMLYHFGNDAGLLSNSTATAAIQEAHLGNFIPKISRRKLERWLKDDTVVVDARLARDYEKGHINSAISIPVNTTDEALRKATEDIFNESRIVLYCQSSGCPFAERMAIKVLKDGFSNVSIFKGGWVEWIANINKDGRAGL